MIQIMKSLFIMMILIIQVPHLIIGIITLETTVVGEMRKKNIIQITVHIVI